MRNPEATKDNILKRSAVLFNTNGYKATSISDITSATGLTKGAVYSHFVNKDQLEIETLGYLSTLLFAKLKELTKKEVTAGDKLRSIFIFFESYITNPPLKGGCPLLNAAIEADDAHVGLRKEALKILSVLRASVISILQKGIEHNQLKPGTDKEFLATIIIAGLEGSIMMSKLERNDNDIKKMIKHLSQQIKDIEI
jgi:TetR/AcrR family transcriptional regulator, transcriptional repressor for nem operon